MVPLSFPERTSKILCFATQGICEHATEMIVASDDDFAARPPKRPKFPADFPKSRELRSRDRFDPHWGVGHAFSWIRVVRRRGERRR